MEELAKKLENLKELIKAIKQAQQSAVPTLPKLPAAPKPPAPPSMKAGMAQAPKIGAGQGPNSKKDPKKIAEQIKNGSMSTKTQKVMLKFEKNGQWSMDDEPTDPSSV